jgi:hypothetical protein
MDGGLTPAHPVIDVLAYFRSEAAARCFLRNADAPPEGDAGVVTQIEDIARDLRAPFSKNDYVPANIAEALDALDALAEFLDGQREQQR